MKLLITSDLHLTIKPEDEYRWGLFEWLKEQVLKHWVDAVCINGDLTDAKDRHSAQLVNRVVAAVAELANALDTINSSLIILKGNHDYIDADTPFFGFMRNIKGVRYVTEPCILTLPTADLPKSAGKLFCLPHHRESFPQLTTVQLACPVMLMHHTFKGAVASTGVTLDGDAPACVSQFKGTIISGDIHVPQQVGQVIYCGAPYRIRFNDAFDPRVLLYTDGRLSDLHFPCLKRHTLSIDDPEDLASCEVSAGDQVKVRLRLKKSRYSEWPTLVDQIYAEGKKLNVTIHAVELESVSRPRLREVESASQPRLDKQSAVDILEDFGKREQLDSYRMQIGKELLRCGD